MSQGIWDLTQLLQIFNQELQARETCLLSALGGKNLNLTLNIQSQGCIPLQHLKAKTLLSHL